MNFRRLVPNIFYTDINDGLKLFIDALGFEMTYDDLGSSEHPFCVVEKDHLKVHLIQDAEFAGKDRPELRLETTDISEAYDKIKASYPELLHPNLNRIKLQHWNAKEFAIRDESGVCIIIQQWQ